jgi:hypothetical protein
VGIIHLNADIWAGSLALVEMQIEEAQRPLALNAAAWLVAAGE